MDSAGLAERLRRLREQRGLEQREVAQRAGLHPSQVSRLEHGATAKPSVFDVQQLAAFYGVTVEYLVGQERPPADLAQRMRAEAAAALADRVLAFLKEAAPAPANTGERDAPGSNGKDNANKSKTGYASPATHPRVALTLG